MKAARAILLFLLSACAATAQTSAPAGTPAAPTRFARADTTALRRTLDSLAGAPAGVVGYSVRNIDTGEQLDRRGDETFPTASLIKISLLVTLFDMVEKGDIALDDPIRVLKVDKVPGSGILQFLHDDVEITVGDAAWLMSTISDNTATNLLIDKVAIRRSWQKMEALGLPHTKLHSKSFLRMTSVAMDSSVIVRDEVLDEKIASFFTRRSSSAYAARFTSMFSTIASMMMSQSARSSSCVVPLSRPRVASRSSAEILPFSTNFPRLFSIPENPRSISFCSVSRTTVS